MTIQELEEALLRVGPGFPVIIQTLNLRKYY